MSPRMCRLCGEPVVYGSVDRGDPGWIHQRSRADHDAEPTPVFEQITDMHWPDGRPVQLRVRGFKVVA